ncbi:hypothetical protein FE257_009377 [Aspergillus nanangensis]|uniref:Amine oxidase domain-containing protein n=1 Tax=Aspergillus nanangensis TaxID=2582783 RepID=A0AAD4CLK9_ASPNN|nr:hypothetical protein FE257_009377 [Aspergillus nanangensis]
MTIPDQPKVTVAVIGSGMAGLVAAFLIQHDQQQRYSVEIFETQDKLSLNSASYSGDDARIDLPMRALDGNFHTRLRQMYDYLGVKYATSKFLYPLSTCSTEGKKSAPYFIHSSSNHQVPPLRPEGRSRLPWIQDIIILASCYFWFTICCFMIAPKAATATTKEESLRQYLDRIRLPQGFRRKYLLPLMSSVTTCSHDALLGFPAVDAIEYAKRTYRQPHYTVVGGVQNVQSKLCKDQVVRLGATVTAVESLNTRVRVTWVDSQSKKESSTVFDHVIMAVTPNVVGAIYEPLKSTMRSLPVVVGESIVHRDVSGVPPAFGRRPGTPKSKEATAAAQEPDGPQIMHICSNDTSTESVHIYPHSIMVTNFPIAPIEPSKIIHRARFTRVLRTPESRAITNRIFAIDGSERTTEDKGETWQNGQGGVWLVGAWCWDGMVLLEGCVVSAMRVATSLGVEIPWSAES